MLRIDSTFSAAPGAENHEVANANNIDEPMSH
jgi:hypothetical protein